MVKQGRRANERKNKRQTNRIIINIYSRGPQVERQAFCFFLASLSSVLSNSYCIRQVRSSCLTMHKRNIRMISLSRDLFACFLSFSHPSFWSMFSQINCSKIMIDMTHCKTWRAWKMMAIYQWASISLVLYWFPFDVKLRCLYTDDISLHIRQMIRRRDNDASSKMIFSLFLFFFFLFPEGFSFFFLFIRKKKKRTDNKEKREKKTNSRTTNCLSTNQKSSRLALFSFW